MSSKEYWDLVTEQQMELKVSARARAKAFEAKSDESKLEGQPLDGQAIYVVSKKNARISTTAGHISLAALRLAAKCIVDESHVVASAAQIAEHLAAEAKRGLRYQHKEKERRARLNNGNNDSQ